MSKGWISLHREFKDHWLWKEKRVYSKAEAWVDILLMANYKDAKVLLGSSLIEVKRGSFITSEIKLMNRWNWSKTKLRSFLFLLTEDKMIIKISDTKKTTLKVCKYNDYQINETTKELRKNHKRTTKELRKDTNNKDNNINKENKENKESEKSPFNLIKSEKQIQLDTWMIQNKKQVNEFEDLISAFNNTAMIEIISDQKPLEFKSDMLLLRFKNFSRSWIANQKKLKSNTSKVSNQINLPKYKHLQE